MIRVPGGPVVGIIGGGQLARMCAPAAIRLGIGLRVLAARPDESAAQAIVATTIGDHDDLDAVLAFARSCDVVTFDHEHVPLAILEELVADGVPVRPGPAALAHAQDKLLMRARLAAAGLPVPKWARVESADDVVSVAYSLGGFPLVLKTARGGYDGRGVWVLTDASMAREVMAGAPVGVEWLAEAFVPFTRELSAQVARSPHGQVAAYPIVQTEQVDGMCRVVTAPAPDLSDELANEAQHVAMSVAAELDVTGMLAVELFETADGILINELAMRPHNSGHWSIDGAITDQFENHLRAVLDWPLGDPHSRTPWAIMVNLVGGQSTGSYNDVVLAYRHVMARDPAVRIHLYGKEVRPGRKLGHVTTFGTDRSAARARAEHAADYLMGEINE